MWNKANGREETKELTHTHTHILLISLYILGVCVCVSWPKFLSYF